MLTEFTRSFRIIFDGERNVSFPEQDHRVLGRQRLALKQTVGPSQPATGNRRLVAE